MRLALALLTSCAALAACAESVPATPPVPADPENVASILEAARDCRAEDFAHLPVAEPGRPEFGGNPTEAQMNAFLSDFYIETMALRPCVYALPSGLHIEITRAVEEGGSPVTGDPVIVNYEGRFQNGDLFDSSYERGQPACFPSDRLISGWVEALPLMRVGEEWTLHIPYQLAYGERGRPPVIPPAKALTFRMELLELPESCPSPM